MNLSLGEATILTTAIARINTELNIYEALKQDTCVVRTNDVRIILTALQQPQQQDSLQEIEEAAFRQYYPPGYIHGGVDSPEDLARVRGVMRQRRMIASLHQPSPERIQALEQIAKLTTELCVAIDRAEEDVGGSRPIPSILGELGPLTDQLEKIL